jgi:hypothetical protein
VVVLPASISEIGDLHLEGELELFATIEYYLALLEIEQFVERLG